MLRAATPLRCLRRFSSEPGARLARTRPIAQPLAATHPHLMSAGETTPGVSADEYSARRRALAEALPPGGLALFPSAAPAYMSHDVQLPYYPDSDLFYLCGFAEQAALLACVAPRAAAAPPRWLLFVRPSCAEEEVWDGARAGVDGARTHILPDGAVHPLEAAARVLCAEVSRGDVGALLCDEARRGDAGARRDARLAPVLAQVLEACGAAAVPRLSARALVHSLRVRKSAAERSLMAASAALCARAFGEVMRASVGAAARGATEGVLAAHFEFSARLEGAERLAYPCVVAGGENAVTLHYMHNNAVLSPGSMLLMDAGASYHSYCSDITRTWPLNGRFDAAQRALYEAVLDVNQRCIEAVRADGQTSLASLHATSVQLTLEHLISLGILRRDDRQAYAKCQRYYPHAIGHWLGLEVHDCPTVGSNQPLQEGMVITIEPGLYFPRDDPELPDWCKGIGIRIEDDVLVNAPGTSATVLTHAAPKQPADIEEMLAAGS
ncbi:hypothetical protein AB1Y20_015715 [Prymnesium parvum]|uniref:Aminopeptidase P N-terminal domain-containing protein n=1 Tax=Prymnesium parvum TaxID=97485 RepID=A0AB34JXW9_PRYPA